MVPLCSASHITRHTSHVTHHTSHITHHPSPALRVLLLHQSAGDGARGHRRFVHVATRHTKCQCMQTHAQAGSCRQLQAVAGKRWCTARRVTRHTLHVTRHTSHVTRHALAAAVGAGRHPGPQHVFVATLRQRVTYMCVDRVATSHIRVSQ